MVKLRWSKDLTAPSPISADEFLMAQSAARYKQNRLQQLRGFCYAARAKSISKAAEKMALSQPSVSLQIKALER
ncbi:MAG TPA: LysR family transcriptional regulator, partial [Lacipirellulaceae bacterium]|nr:LysR family transcriptional regulator [Lacipirellulaceae bacterium]